MKRPPHIGTGRDARLYRLSVIAVGLVLSVGALGASLAVVPRLLPAVFHGRSTDSREDRHQETIYLHYLTRICSPADSTHTESRTQACRQWLLPGSTSR